ncbi:3-hydroxyacyl-CoA dehydrogenase NAD-binding domain-containing protein [Salinithrix halophila]|uniref:3-hydroxyacyl-CoA dehydrogenase NAD-binding domain-containing protein n=1 Tax=Salinithrix halophila TaxID=1485204 RepID=A0ABV8JAI8_9BACL
MVGKQPCAVLGAGTMGGGIAQFLAAAGCEVFLYDLGEELLSRGMESIRARLGRRVEKGKLTPEAQEEILARIRPVTDLRDLASACWVIEAVVERLDVKKELFAKVEERVDAEAVLATNTSSLSVTSVAANLRRPERLLGLHFFNPAPVMPLVEVVLGARTDLQVAETAAEWICSLGKDPVLVKDTPGFLVNRVARHFHSEAYRIVGEGLADKEQVDRILRGAGYKMGPFELQDLIGVDINYAASVSVYEGFFHDPRFRPHPDQRLLVESGDLGRKTGRGHYAYDG